MKDSQNTSKYVVTLKSLALNQSFYSDMEGCGCSSKYVPERSVECCSRLPSGPNVIYDLTDDEAEQLKNDDRVLDIIKFSDVPNPIPASVNITDYFYSGPNRKYWRSASTPPNISSMDNHSLLRCSGESVPSNWGGGNSDTNQTTGFYSSFWTGMNVDIITMEGDPDGLNETLSVSRLHSDYKNRFGSGSRLIKYNWEQDVNEKTTIAGISDFYANYPDNCLMHHAAGTLSVAGGLRGGFAKDANLYVLYHTQNSNGINSNKVNTYEAFEYVRKFHQKKVNSGQKNSYGHINPTVLILEFQRFHYSRVNINFIQSITYRGTTITKPEKGWDIDALEGYKLNPFYYGISSQISISGQSILDNTLSFNDIEFEQSYSTGDRVLYTGSSIQGLVDGKIYYLIKVYDQNNLTTKYKFASTYSDAISGNAINIFVYSIGTVKFTPITGEKDVGGYWYVHHSGDFKKEDEIITSWLADIEATVDSGVNVLCAMGNGCHTRAPWSSTGPEHIDYNNYYTVSSSAVTYLLSYDQASDYMYLTDQLKSGKFYYNRPIGPEGCSKAINVSALNPFSIEQLESYSNKGPATSVCSPGAGQMSAFSNYWGTDNGSEWGPFSGTSAATPTAAGILACLLEYNMASTSPTNLLWTPAQAKQSLCSTYAKQNSIRDISYTVSNYNSATKVLSSSDPEISDVLFTAALYSSNINRRLHDTPNAIVQLPSFLRRERVDSTNNIKYTITNDGTLLGDVKTPSTQQPQATRQIRIGFAGRNNGGNARYERQISGSDTFYAVAGGGGAGFHGGGGATRGGGGGGGAGLAREDASVANSKTRQGGNSSDGFVRIWLNEKSDGTRDTWNQNPFTR